MRPYISHVIADEARFIRNYTLYIGGFLRAIGSNGVSIHKKRRTEPPARFAGDPRLGATHVITAINGRKAEVEVDFLRRHRRERHVDVASAGPEHSSPLDLHE